MVIVIIAGGSGTRLWPLSQSNYPKHLLTLTGENSLLQNTYDRARQLTDQIYVVTEASHSNEVARQLPKLAAHQLVVEPARRGTASCFVLALSRIREYADPSEPVVFIHADHHISDTEGFCLAVKAAAAASTAKKAIALVGIVPSQPATGFGYIEHGEKVATEEGLPVYSVTSFHEKPAVEIAQQYLDAGNYLWNQGLFAAPLEVWVDQFKQYDPEYYNAYVALAEVADEPDKFRDIYLALRNDAIDYALMEKSKELVVVPGKYDWADIGSFFDLHAVLHAMQGNADHNVTEGDVHMINCEDSMVHSTTGKPVAAIGLSGIIVIDTPEGVLVCTKEQAQMVKEISKKLAARDAAKH
jgi:mannose-1-phosphate guanylyltransferase/mannose-6-phosphate isomerase